MLTLAVNPSGARPRNNQQIESDWSASFDSGSDLPSVEAPQRARHHQRHRGEAEPEGARVQRAPRLEVSDAREQRVGDGEVAQPIQDVHARRRQPAERGRGERGRQRRAPARPRRSAGRSWRGRRPRRSTRGSETSAWDLQKATACCQAPRVPRASRTMATRACHLVAGRPTSQARSLPEDLDQADEDASNEGRARRAQRARRAAGARGHRRRAGRVRLQGVSHGPGERGGRGQQDHDLPALARQGAAGGRRRRLDAQARA